MPETEKENDLRTGEDEPITLSELYARYGLDDRGQRHFGRYVTVWRNAAEDTRRSKRKLWRGRRVSSDLGWLIFMCDKNNESVPPLSVAESEWLQSDLAEAIAFCKKNG